MRVIIFLAVLLSSFPAAASSLNEVRDFVMQATESLPSRFADVGIVPASHQDRPLPPDVLAYARFYWTLDRIEGNCEFLGQRSNVEMVEPSVQTLLTYAMLNENHPDRLEYIKIVDLVDGAEEEIGEDALCPAMYEMLGPNGTLMGTAIKINDLLEDELRHKYQVRIEDGILWSTRDYCERRFHLQPPADQAWHDFTCEKAKEQKF